MRFDGKRVLVTGASRGLGRFIAEAFAGEGAHVGIGYRVHEREARAVLEVIESSGKSATLVPFDVRDAGAVDSAIDAFANDGGLDVLVNAAAAVRDQPMLFLSPADWDEVIAVGLTGTYHCCRAAARRMLPNGRGAIVNIGSVAGRRASPGQANYSAAKGGVESLTATAGAELASRGVRVNAVIPGLLTTGMALRLNRDAAEIRRKHVPLGRFGDGAEVARVVLFLASDDASYIVGQCLVVDGGLSL